MPEREPAPQPVPLLGIVESLIAAHGEAITGVDRLHNLQGRMVTPQVAHMIRTAFGAMLDATAGQGKDGISVNCEIDSAWLAMLNVDFWGQDVTLEAALDDPGSPLGKAAAAARDAGGKLTMDCDEADGEEYTYDLSWFSLSIPLVDTTQGDMG